VTIVSPVFFLFQVWFQNARAKWRRTVQRQPGGGTMPGTPAPGGAGSDGSQDAVNQLSDVGMTSVPGMDGMDMDSMDMTSLEHHQPDGAMSTGSRTPPMSAGASLYGQDMS
jgi:hypothetical protein